MPNYLSTYLLTQVVRARFSWPPPLPSCQLVAVLPHHCAVDGPFSELHAASPHVQATSATTLTKPPARPPNTYAPNCSLQPPQPAGPGQTLQFALSGTASQSLAPLRPPNDITTCSLGNILALLFTELLLSSIFFSISLGMCFTTLPLAGQFVC